MEKIMYVGLGNPLYKYKNTRHNVGFIFIDRLAKKLNIKMKFSKFYKAIIGESGPIVLVKPQTYMNSSGISVKNIMKMKNVKITNIYIIHDDVTLALGKSRLKDSGSSHGGHNGIKSVIKELNSKDAKRIKIGIGETPENKDLINHVLGNFSDTELDIIIPIIDNYIEKIIGGKLDV